MLEPILFGFKIFFLVLLYLFIFMIVRRLARDLSRGAEPVEMPSKPVPPPAVPAARQAPAKPRRPEAAPAPAAPEEAGSTREFDELLSKIKPRLVVQHSKVIEDGKIFMLKGGATIGRSPGSDIVLPDEYVSQTHARIFPRKQFLFLEDLGSTNGTIIDGRKVEGERQIRPGQEVVIGDTIFRYEE